MMRIKGCAAFLIMLLAMPLIMTPSMAAQQPSPVKIGVLLPLTGPDAKRGMHLYEGIVTARSLKPEISGSPINLIPADTESTREGTVNAMKRLLEEQKVLAVIGEAGPDNTRTASTLSEKADIPLVVQSVHEDDLTRDCDYLFRTCLSDSALSSASAWYAVKKLGARNAAVMVDIADEDSVRRAMVFKKHFSDLGGKIVAVAYCQSGDVDVNVPLEYMISQKADVIFLPEKYREVVLACSRALEAGYKGHIMTMDHADRRQLIEQGGPSVDGVLMIDHFDIRALQTALGQAYAEQFSSQTGKELNAENALGADAYFSLREALERTESRKGPAIRKTMTSDDEFTGIMGRIVLSSGGEAKRAAVVLQVRNDEFTYLETINPEPGMM